MDSQLVAMDDEIQNRSIHSVKISCNCGYPTDISSGLRLADSREEQVYLRFYQY